MKFILLCLSLIGFAQAAVIDPMVIKTLAASPEVEIIAIFDITESLATLSISQLKALTKKKLKNLGNINATPLWITHGFYAKINQKILAELLKNQDIKSIFFNRPFKFETVQSAQPTAPKAQYFAENIKLNIVNAFYPEITGHGVKVGIIDTGVDADHEFLKEKIKIFYNPDLGAPSRASDFSGHGTHVTGIVAQVAPKCEIISVQIHDVKTAFRAMEFLTDPDGDPSTNDWPLVVNNSWGQDNLPEIELYYRALQVWDSLGIIAVFSAGNNGLEEGSISEPKNYPTTIVVAATDANGVATEFSSRGPVVFNGSTLLKPEISAPGDKIISTLPGNLWGEWTGTSMAAPFVTGTLALISQANPRLTAKEKRDILLKSAFTRVYTWDPKLGFGELDVLESVRLAIDLGF
ncbi:MAG: S8 family serine peptidase [Pseudomonadota bacterium]|nr:S8 family serine peptidase [Pseudomonadota bacterium]